MQSYADSPLHAYPLSARKNERPANPPAPQSHSQSTSFQNPVWILFGVQLLRIALPRWIHMRDQLPFLQRPQSIESRPNAKTCQGRDLARQTLLQPRQNTQTRQFVFIYRRHPIHGVWRRGNFTAAGIGHTIGKISNPQTGTGPRDRNRNISYTLNARRTSRGYHNPGEFSWTKIEVVL